MKLIYWVVIACAATAALGVFVVPLNSKKEHCMDLLKKLQQNPDPATINQRAKEYDTACTKPNT